MSYQEIKHDQEKKMHQKKDTKKNIKIKKSLCSRAERSDYTHDGAVITGLVRIQISHYLVFQEKNALSIRQ